METKHKYIFSFLVRTGEPFSFVTILIPLAVLLSAKIAGPNAFGSVLMECGNASVVANVPSRLAPAL